MDEPLKCPPWCSRPRCTAEAGPVNGHGIGVHRSTPSGAGLTETYLVQTPGADRPSVEVARSGASVRMPLPEGGALGDAIALLLEQAGLRP